MNLEGAEKSDLEMDSSTAAAATAATRPAVYIVVQGSAFTPDDQHFKKTFPKKVVLVLSALHLICCAIAVFCQVKENFTTMQQ